MANTYFRFKQFTIYQDRCAMKLSTDAVILGALASHHAPHKILDIGTGTGAIALMAAQKYPEAAIHAVEIDHEAACQAKQNFRASKWKENLFIFRDTFQRFSQSQLGKYDLIISNPPYFPNHIKSTDAKRNMAIHSDDLPFDDLLMGASTLLSNEGRFFVILPPRQMQEFKSIADKKSLYLQAVTTVYDNPKAKALREVCVFAKAPHPSLKTEVLYIKSISGEFSHQYRELLKDYMLHF